MPKMDPTLQQFISIETWSMEIVLDAALLKLEVNMIISFIIHTSAFWDDVVVVVVGSIKLLGALIQSIREYKATWKYEL